ncbi:MAG: restriction endonuclease [Chloroflexota bacterium]|nr:restriction endonuclease [Chloroflexota bacterium]
MTFADLIPHMLRLAQGAAAAPQGHPVSECPSLDELRRRTPEEFEQWVGEQFRTRGYLVRHVGVTRASEVGDHGVDLFVERRGERAIVQCKKFGLWKVGEPTVRGLYGTLMHERADRAYLVTTGRATQPARSWVVGKPIEIWDAAYLVEAGMAAPPEARTRTDRPEEASDGGDARQQASVGPVCPRCGGPMVRRLAQKGAHQGEAFFGCATFPRCRGKRPI